MRIDDRLIGLGMALLALAIIFGSLGLPSVPGTTYGPNLMPTIIGIGFAVLSIRIFIVGWRARDGARWIDLSQWSGRTRSLLCVVWTLGGIVFGLVLFEPMGFLLYGLAFMLPLMLLMGAGPVTAIATTVPTILLAQFGFANLMLVPLPVGPLPLPW